MTIPVRSSLGPPNLLASPADLSTASWSPTGATIAAGGIANPLNGAVDTWALKDDSSSGGHLILQNVPGASLAGHSLTLSVYVKAGTAPFIALGGNGGAVAAWFDIAGVAVGTVVGGVAAISALPGGWVWCRFTFAATGAFSNQIIFYASHADATLTFTGNGATALTLYAPDLVQA